MPRYYLSRKGGVIIETPQGQIELLLESIKGTSRKKTGTVRVTDSTSIQDSLVALTQQGYVEIADRVLVRIGETSQGTGLSLDIRHPDDYKVTVAL